MVTERTALPREDLSAGVVARYRRSHRPVILRGASFPAFSRWSFPALAASLEAEGRIVSGLPLRGNPYDCLDRVERRAMRLRDLLPLLHAPSRSRPCYFLTGVLPPSIRHDVPFADLDPEAATPHEMTLWAGSEGTRSGLHFDYVDNFLAQIEGSKHVLVAGPESSRSFYPRPSNHCNSQVDSDDPDPGRFPAYAEASFLEGVLAPGEVLYIPAGFWHSIRALSPSISVSCFFGVELPLSYHARIIGLGGARGAARVARDAVWHGVLGRPYVKELYTPACTGDWLVILGKRRLRGLWRQVRAR